MGLRKVTPSADPLLGFFIDGLEANLSWYRTSNSSVTSRVDAEGVDARVGTERRLEPREFGAVPGVLKPVLRWLLPGALEEAVLDARVRWSPERIGLGTSYSRQDAAIRRFDRILERSADSAVVVAAAPREFLETAAELGFRPLNALTADFTFLSTRDLLDPIDAVTDPRLRALLAAERTEVVGVDVGWETRRSLRSRVSYRPRVVPWLDHEITWSSRYDGERNASFVEIVEQPLDSIFRLQRNAAGERDVSTLVSFDAATLGRSLAGSDPTARGAAWARISNAIQPITFTSRDGLFSRFDRDPVDPGLAYQLGWTGRSGYLTLSGDTAATVVDQSSRQVTWGLAAAGITFDATWGVSEAATLDARAGRTIRAVTWPDLRARISVAEAPEGSSRPLQGVAVGTGIREEERELVYGDGGQRRVLDERSFPWDLSLRWRGGLTTA